MAVRNATNHAGLCHLPAHPDRSASRSACQLQEILPGLYLGPYGAAKDLPTLHAHRVTHILVIGPFRPFRPIVAQCTLIIVLPFRMGCPERLLFSHVLSACLRGSRWSWRTNFYRITAGCRVWHRDTHCNVGASDRAVRAEREACLLAAAGGW